MLDLSEKTVAVTGASKGIGFEIVRSLGRCGANVVAQYRTDRAGAEASVDGLPEDRSLIVQADFSERGSADSFWNVAHAWKGRIDVLVANAAVMRLEGGIDADDSSWDRVWDEAVNVNMLSPVRLMRDAVRCFVDQGGGVLICISSWTAGRGASNPEGLAYAATKAGVTAAAKTIARAYAAKNVLTYIVSPGVVRTRMSEDFAATHGGEEAVTATLAMREWVPPAEIGELVAFLATGRVRHLTGATIDVNGATYVR